MNEVIASILRPRAVNALSRYSAVFDVGRTTELLSVSSAIYGSKEKLISKSTGLSRGDDGGDSGEPGFVHKISGNMPPEKH